MFSSVLLLVDGLSEKRPSVMRRDSIFVRVVDEKTEYEGTVSDVLKEAVIISGLDAFLIERIRRAKKMKRPLHFAVRFQFSNIPHETQRAAVDAVTKNSKFMNLLFPGDFQDHGRYHSSAIQSCNSEQNSAVSNIVFPTAAHRAPYILFGPPGTGKSVTLVETIIQIRHNIKGSKILVCAPSNSICDYLAEKLVNSGYFPVSYDTRKNDWDACKCGTFPLIRLHSSNRSDPIPDGIAHISTSKTSKSVFERTSVMVCTLITAARLKISSKKFSHVVIDEAGQAAECEAIVGIADIMEERTGKLILSGDPYQLGPVCSSKRAASLGLGVSLLDRLMKLPLYQQQCGAYNPRYITKLRKNFRSHPDILRISNELFYGNQLQALAQYQLDRISEFCYKTGKHHGGTAVVFHSITEPEKKDNNSPSFYNPAEIDQVMAYVAALLTSSMYNVEQDDIGIVTPYAKQVQRLKQELKKRKWTDVLVGSTEVFQGREKRIMIVSTVRSQPAYLNSDKHFRLGFVKDPRRFNVILTRAKAKMIIVGNPNVLNTDENWKKLIDMTIAQGGYIKVQRNQYNHPSRKNNSNSARRQRRR